MKKRISFIEIIIALMIIMITAFIAFGKLFHSFGW